MIKSQLLHCTLVSMFCSRASNNFIDTNHELSLRSILNNHKGSFMELLQVNNDITSHQANIQILLNEVFNTSKNSAPPILEAMFHKRINYSSLGKVQRLETEEKRKNGNGLECVNYRAAQLWSLLLDEIKFPTFLDNFKHVLQRRYKEVNMS